MEANLPVSAFYIRKPSVAACLQKPYWQIELKLTPQDLLQISDVTLKDYDQRAEAFWEGTRDHNVSQNIEALLQHIEGKAPLAILGFGCGPERDLKVNDDNRITPTEQPRH